MRLQIADVLRCARNYMQALGLKKLEPHGVAVGSMSPNWASIIHHETYELLVQRQSIPDGDTAGEQSVVKMFLLLFNLGGRLLEFQEELVRVSPTDNIPN